MEQRQVLGCEIALFGLQLKDEPIDAVSAINATVCKSPTIP